MRVLSRMSEPRRPAPQDDRVAPASIARPNAPSPLRAYFAARGRNRRMAADSVIALEQEPAEAIHLVLTGVARCYVMSEDGRRNISRFAWPGDFIGCVAIDAWHFSAEAIDTLTLRSIKRDALESALLRDGALQRDLRREVAQEMRRREAHIARIASLSAEARLLDFLHEVAGHASEIDGFSQLPLMRRDIADFLGMSIETTSRTFTSLRRSGRLQMRGVGEFRIRGDAPSRRKLCFDIRQAAAPAEQ